ncbi:S-layer homology domain-containing protein [Clostridium sp.]|uniref:S-layer homology domain-containing protein n=1 Tax=Clostridium sp. TaxID=1506 RepID=UPI003F3D961C
MKLKKRLVMVLAASIVATNIPIYASISVNELDTIVTYTNVGLALEPVFETLNEGTYFEASETYKEFKGRIDGIKTGKGGMKFKEFEDFKVEIEADTSMSVMEKLAIMKGFQDKYGKKIYDDRQSTCEDDDTGYGVEVVSTKLGTKYEHALRFKDSNGSEFGVSDIKYTISGAAKPKCAVIPSMTNDKYITGIIGANIVVFDVNAGVVSSELRLAPTASDSYITHTANITANAMNSSISANGDAVFYTDSYTKDASSGVYTYNLYRVDFDYSSGGLTLNELYEGPEKVNLIYNRGTFNLGTMGYYIANSENRFGAYDLNDSNEIKDAIAAFDSSKAFAYSGPGNNRITLDEVFGVLAKSTNSYDIYSREIIDKVFPSFVDRLKDASDLMDMGDVIPSPDVDNPVITSIVKSPTDWTNKTVTVTVTVTATDDKGLAAQPYSFNNGVTWQSSNFKTFMGNETFTLVVKDATDKITQQEVIVDNIDKDMPVINSVTTDPISFPSNDTMATVIIDAVDITSGIKEYSFDGGVTWQGDDKKTFTEDTLVDIQVKDNAGNITSYGSQINIDIKELTGITINGGDKVVMAGETIPVDYTLITKAVPTVSWQVHDSSLANVDSSGNVTGIQVGDTQLTITVNGTNISHTVNLKVVPFEKSVTYFDIVLDEITLKVGDREGIDYVINPEDATNKKVNWTSTDNSIISVAGDKLVAIKNGTVVVTGTTVDGGYTDSIIVNVEDTKQVQSIAIADMSGIKLEYNLNEPFRPQGELIVTYTDGTTELIKIQSNHVSSFDTSIVGMGVVELNYGGKYITYDIDVIEKNTPVSITAIPNTTLPDRSVKLSVSVTGDFLEVIVPSGGKIYTDIFDYNITENGTYTFSVIGKDSKSRDSVVVNVDNIDKVAPLITFRYDMNTPETSQVNVIENGSGLDSLVLPSGSIVASVPHIFDMTQEQGTFMATDKAGNVSASNLFVSNVTINYGTSTFVGVEGIPTTWTNKPVAVSVGALNKIEGVLSVEVNGDKSKGELKTVSVDSDNITTGSALNLAIGSTDTVINTKNVTKNGTITYTITTPTGQHTDSAVVDKLDFVAPIIEANVLGNMVSYAVRDDLSGIRYIYLPNGDVIENTQDKISDGNGTFSVDANGNFEIVVEDFAGNITTKIITVSFDPNNPSTNPPEIPPVSPPEIPPVDPKPPTGGDSGNGGSSGGGGSSKPSIDKEVEDAKKELDKLTPYERIEAQKKLYNAIPFTVLTSKYDLANILKINANFIEVYEQDMENGVTRLIIDILGLKVSSDVLFDSLEPVNNKFMDMGKHWAELTVDEVKNMGYFIGTSVDKFSPKSGLTFADTLTALDRVLLNYDILEVKNPRSYVEELYSNKDHWAYYSVNSIVSKLEKETIRKIMMAHEYSDLITREELAQIIFEATSGKLIQDVEIPMNSFDDVKDVKYIDAVTYCVRTGILIGDNVDKLNPQENLTRAEYATIILRLNEALSRLK